MAPALASARTQRLLGLIKHHWLASGTVYGYRKITLDLREAGEHCSRHRVLRLMRPRACVRRSGMAASRAIAVAPWAW